MSLDARVGVTVGTITLHADLSVADGEMLAVLGPNGAGKTTLLRAIAGLLPIDEGRIVIDDRVVDDPDHDVFVAAERRSVGVVFHDYLLFAQLTALDIVAFGLRERGMKRADARARARQLLADVGVEAKAGARPRELSGGQAQRIALARALATEPTLLLLDEPLAALDVQTRSDTRRHLRETLTRFRGARLLVTHDPVDALTLADRLLIIEDGRVVQIGTPDEIVARPRSEYVAELVGMNLYRGTTEPDGAHVRVGDALLAASDPPAGDVVAIVPPNAVVLHRSTPSGSARNVWPGHVVALERHGGRVRVRIDGTLPIVAEITPAAVDELELAPGTPVCAAVKATEIAVYAV